MSYGIIRSPNPLSPFLDVNPRPLCVAPLRLEYSFRVFGVVRESTQKVISKTYLESSCRSATLSIPISDFSKIEMKVGRIASVEDIPAARKPMYKLTVEFGERVSKQCVAGIKDRYQKEELVGKVVVAVLNLQPKPVAGVMSECMLLAAFNENELSLLIPDRDVSIGSTVG